MVGICNPIGIGETINMIGWEIRAMLDVIGGSKRGWSRSIQKGKKGVGAPIGNALRNGSGQILKHLFGHVIVNRGSLVEN